MRCAETIRILLLGLAVYLLPQQQSIAWTVTAVDADVTKARIGVQTDDVISIVYIKQGDLWKAVLQSGTWSNQRILVDACGRTPVDMLVDRQGYVHLLCPYQGYRTNSSGVWVTETIDCPPIKSGKIVEDAAGHIHTAYHCGSKDDGLFLKYANNTASVWTTETVSSLGYTDGVSLAMDSAGKAHITYVATRDTVTYATNAAGSWNLEPVEICWCDGQTDVVVDALDRPHVTYRRSLSIRYAQKTGNAWVLELIPSKGDRSRIALDSLSRPNIAFEFNGAVLYARRGDSSWKVEQVADGSSSAPSIAITSDDYSHLSFIDTGLKHARQFVGKRNSGSNMWLRLLLDK